MLLELSHVPPFVSVNSVAQIDLSFGSLVIEGTFSLSCENIVHTLPVDFVFLHLPALLERLELE